MNKYQYQDFLNSSEWIKLRNIYKNDSNTSCWICGSKDEINLHHFIYQKKLLLDPTNIVSLCAKHHYLLHFISGKKKIHRNFRSLKGLRERLKNLAGIKI